MKVRAGRFEIDADEKGYPHWVQIIFDRETTKKVVLRIHHTEMADLEYAISRARTLLRSYVPEGVKGQV